MRNEYKVVAIVVTYNRIKLLLECLDALFSQTLHVDSIYVVDNASTDGTKDILAEKGYLDRSEFHYIGMETNTGGAGGFYEGLRQARECDSDWVWIMDDDTIPTSSCLEKLIEAKEILDEKKPGEDTAFLASAVYGPDGEFMNLPELDVRPSENGYAYWYSMLKYGMVNIVNATFVSILVNSKAINKCGLPCKNYFIWGDDSEYTKRLSTYFGKAYFVGNSIAVHKRYNAKSLNIENEADTNRIKMFHYLYRNQLINGKYYKEVGYLPLRLIVSLICCLPVLFNSQKRQRKWVKVVGTWEAITQYKSFKSYIDGQLNGEK